MVELTAHAPVPSLLTSLQRAGWGELGTWDFQGVRSTLLGLAAQLPHRSGMGSATVPQVADSAGLSPRWVGRCLAILEDLGLITWERGCVQAGKPVPSHFRINKRALLDLIRAARPLRAARDAARRAETAARIAAARLHWTKGRRRNRRSGHVELSSSPSTLRGGYRAPTAGCAAPATPPSDGLTPSGGTPMPAYLRDALRARDVSIIDAHLKGQKTP